jgi:DtxR family manganese transport transcriptional regulator
VQRLQREGLVESEPYRAIFLTPAGEAMAAAARRRHQILYDFLRAIGIDETIAQADSEGMEHHVSEETLIVFERMTRSLRDKAVE